MALLYHRARRLNLLKSLDVESTFCILRRMPGMVPLITKAGNSKKPIRYTSIKKAKPKTIIDIGNMLLQRASKAKESQQLVIGEAALKAATQTASKAMATSGHVPAITNTVAAKKPVIKAEPELSVISTPTFSATVNRCVDNLFETSTHVKTDEETVLEPPVSRNKPSTKASASSELSSHVSTSFRVSLEEMPKTKHISYNDIDEITSTHHAVPETSHALANETYFGICPSAGTLIPTPGDVPDLSPDLSPVTNNLIEATNASGDTEMTHAPKDTTSTIAGSVSDINDIMPLQDGASLENKDGPNMCTHRKCVPLNTSEVRKFQTQSHIPELSASRETTFTVQDLGSLKSPMTRETSTDSTSSSQIPFKEETTGHKHTPEVEIGSVETAYKLPFTEPNISPVVLNKDCAAQEVAPEEIVLLTRQPEIMDASTEKGPDVILETVCESSLIWSKKGLTRSDPADAELAEDELKTEECSVQEVSHAQLDPIQKLFLDKIREFSTKSKACDRLLDAGPEYNKAFLEELTKLQKLYSNGDLSSFPEFKFPEPVLDENER